MPVVVFETYLLQVGHNTKDKQDLCMFWICLWNKPSSFWRLTIDQQSLALLLDCVGGTCQDSLPPAHLPYHLKPPLNWANWVFYKVSYLSCIRGMGIFWSLLPFHPAQSHSLPSRSEVPVSPHRRMWSCARHCRFPPPFTTVQPSPSAPACKPKWPVWNEAELVRLRWDRCREGSRGYLRQGRSPPVWAFLAPLLLAAVAAAWQWAWVHLRLSHCSADGLRLLTTVRHPLFHTPGTSPHRVR